MIDEDSLPSEIREARSLQKQKQEQEKAAELMQQEAASNDSSSVHLNEGTGTGMVTTQQQLPPPPPPLLPVPLPINFSIPPPNMSLPPPQVMPDAATMQHQPPPPPPPPPHNVANKFQANPLLVLNNPVPMLTPPPLPPALFSQPPPPLPVPPSQFSRPPPPLPWPVRGPPPTSSHQPSHSKHSGLTGANVLPLGIPIRGIRPGLSLGLLPPHGPDGDIIMALPAGSHFNPKIMPPPRVAGDQDSDLAASDDPFAPSVYELKMSGDGRSPFPRGLLSPIRPLIPGVRFDEPPPGRGPPFPGNGRWDNQQRGAPGGRDYNDRRNDRSNRGNGSSNGGGDSPAVRAERPTGIRISSRSWGENSAPPNGSDNERNYDNSEEVSHQSVDQNIRVKNEVVEST